MLHPMIDTRQASASHLAGARLLDERPLAQPHSKGLLAGGRAVSAGRLTGPDGPLCKMDKTYVLARVTSVRGPGLALVRCASFADTLLGMRALGDGKARTARHRRHRAAIIIPERRTPCQADARRRLRRRSPLPKRSSGPLCTGHTPANGVRNPSPRRRWLVPRSLGRESRQSHNPADQGGPRSFSTAALSNQSSIA